MTSCFVYKVIRDLESIDHVCIHPIHRIGLITSDLLICVSSSGVYKLMFYLTIVNKILLTVTLGWHDSTKSITIKIMKMTNSSDMLQNNYMYWLTVSIQ